MPHGQRRLAAIMFTDMVGYTALGQRNESLSLVLVEEQRKLLRPIFSRHNGREVKTIGDAFLVEFPSALEAVRCAYDIQRATREFNISLPEDRRLHLRIGVHLGDVIESEGDISGDAVNVASRIEPLAEDGGVCLTRQVYDHVQNKFELSLTSLGTKLLKNVNAPLEVYKMVMPWEGAAPEETTELDKRRVAVLPLNNLSPDPNDEYFTDGMTEELITALSSVAGLTVIARTSVMQYKNAPKRIAEIGRELNAGTLIEGSVRKAANKVRIAVQLINAKDEGHLWAQNYDEQLDDVFMIQSEVAQKVAEALKVRLLDADRRKIERGPTQNVEAYTLYLKGMFYWNKRSPDALRQATEFFEQAVALDPTFALGYAGIAQAYQVMAANYLADPAVYYPKAKEYALRALSLDDDLAEAHTVLAAVFHNYERDWAKSEAEFIRAIESNPNDATAHQWHGLLLGWAGRDEEGMKEMKKALELNPLSLIINTNIGDFLYYEKKFDEAIAQFNRVVDMDPNFAPVYTSLITSYLAKSMRAEALQALETYSKLASPPLAKLWSAYVRAAMGEAKESRRILSEIQGTYKEMHIEPYEVACVYFLLGDNDEGFEWLEKAYSGYNRTIFLMPHDRELDNVRSDPRYTSLLQRLGLVQFIEQS